MDKFKTVMIHTSGRQAKARNMISYQPLLPRYQKDKNHTNIYYYYIIYHIVSHIILYY
jgi:hypothetical protein